MKSRHLILLGLIYFLILMNAEVALADTLYFTTELGHIGELNSQGSISYFASVNQPEGIAYRDGYLYVSGNGSGISKISLTGDVSNFATVSGGTFGLAFDSNGNLLVADYSDSKILKIAQNGGVSTFYSGINEPVGLAVDSSNNVFVSDPSVGDIYKITPSGTKSIFASGLSYPEGLVFDTSGNLYFVDSSPYLTKISSSGSINSTFANVGYGGFGLTIDSQNKIIMANLNAAQIEKISPDGTVNLVAKLQSEQPVFIVDVPEPSTCDMLLSGVAALALLQLCALRRTKRGGISCAGSTKWP